MIRSRRAARLLGVMILAGSVAACGSDQARTAPSIGTVHRGAVHKTMILIGSVGGGNSVVAVVGDPVWTEVKVDQPVRVRVDMFPDIDLGGKVTSVSPYSTVLNQQRGYHYVNIDITDPLDPRVAPSQRVRAIVTTADVPSALVVPNGAIGTDGGQSWVTTPDGRRLPFTPGAVGDDVTEVTSGLGDGQAVRIP